MCPMEIVHRPEYKGEVYRTPRGTLLLFMGGADRWLGPWPGMSWDILYDRYGPIYLNLLQTRYPSIWIGPLVDYCRPSIVTRPKEYSNLVRQFKFDAAHKLVIKPRCNNVTQYQRCSFECWYLAERQLLVGRIIDGTEPRESLDRFEQAFGPFKSEWTKYRKRWA